MKSASVIVVFVGRPMRSSRLAFHPPGRLPLGVASASDPVFRTEPQRGLVPAIMDLEVEVPVGSLTHAGVAFAWFQGALELPDPRPNDPVKYCRLEPGSDPLQDQLGADGLLLVQRPLERDLLGEAAPWQTSRKSHVPQMPPSRSFVALNSRPSPGRPWRNSPRSRSRRYSPTRQVISHRGGNPSTLQCDLERNPHRSNRIL